MAGSWDHTRQVLLQLHPSEAGRYLTKLLWKGPQIVTYARTLLRTYPLHDDRFKIHMIHYLHQLLPGELEPLYEALLQDIMADKQQLRGSM